MNQLRQRCADEWKAAVSIAQQCKEASERARTVVEQQQVSLTSQSATQTAAVATMRADCVSELSQLQRAYTQSVEEHRAANSQLTTTLVARDTALVAADLRQTRYRSSLKSKRK